MWASYGIISAKDDNPDVPQVTKDFVKGILGVAAFFFLARVAIVILRQFKTPLGRNRVSYIE